MKAFEDTQRRRLLDRRARLPATPEGEVEGREIDAALERLQAGGYGRCERCNSAIGLSRLVALPAARRCLSCDGTVTEPTMKPVDPATKH